MTVFASAKARLATMLPAGSLRARFAVGAFWSILGTVVSQGMGLAATAVAARLLGKAAFGELGMIQSTVGMLGVFAGLGLGLTATRYVAEFRSKEPVRAGRIIGLSYIVALVSGGTVATLLALAAPYLATHTINAPHLTVELRLGSGLLLFNTLNGVQTGALAGLEAFKTIAKANLLTGLLNLPLVVVGVYFWNLPGAVGGMVASAAVGCLINWVALRAVTHSARVPVSCSSIRSELAVLWSFSVPAFLSGAMVGPVTWLANALLVQHPNGYAEMGVFTAANRFQPLFTLAGSTVGAALLPILASKGGAASDRLSRGNILVSWALGAFPAVLLLSFPEVVGLVFGPEYSGLLTQRVFILLILSTCVMMYKQGLARVLAARSLMWWGLISNSMWSVVLLGGFLGLRKWGAAGLAGSFLAAYALNTLVFVPFYTRRGLVPRSTMVSREAAGIWLAMALAALPSFYGCAVFIRGGALALSGLVLLLAFTRLLRGVRLLADTSVR